MIVLNSLFPVLFLLLLGAVLQRLGVTGKAFFQTSDSLVYHIFFPAMLFWKIGVAPPIGDIGLDFCIAALITIVMMFLLSIIGIRLLRVTDYGAGSFSQSFYRFNTYIGMAVVINALGENGIHYFGILIGIAIPVINVLAVGTLIWFSGRTFKPGERPRMIAATLLSNPLILACIAGMVYAATINHFPAYLENSFRLMTAITLPLALLSIGGSLTFTGVRRHARLSLLAAGAKLLVMPVLGLLWLTVFHVTGPPFRVTMIFFSLPTATSLYILSSQLNSDTELASAAIVISTVLSFVSMSIALLF